MAQRRKLCRCIACPRYIEDEQIFCQVHFRQLSPAILMPVSANREPPINSTNTIGRRIIAGTAAAVSFIAKKEGRAAVAVEAATGPAQVGQTIGGTRDLRTTRSGLK